MDEGQEAVKDLIAPLFAAMEGGPFAVYLYGSRACGSARPGSDYDIALVAPAPLERAKLDGIRDALEDLLSCDVDCVDMREIPLTLAAQVLDSGIVLIEGDRKERAMVETRLMSLYATLNEERRGILEDIVKRGSVYAR